MNLIAGILWFILGTLFVTDVFEATKWHAAGYAFLLSFIFFLQHLNK